MGIAAQALHFEVAVAGVEGIAQGRGRLRRPVKREHASGPCFASKPVGSPTRVRGAFGLGPNGAAVDAFSRFAAHGGDDERARRFEQAAKRGGKQGLSSYRSVKFDLRSVRCAVRVNPSQAFLCNSWWRISTKVIFGG